MISSVFSVEITVFSLCVCAKSLQSYLTLCNPMDWSPPGSSIHGIRWASILEWAAVPSSKASSWPRDWTCISYISCIGRQVLYHYRHLGRPALSQHYPQFSSVQPLSPVRLFVTPWTTAHQASLSITNSQSPPKPMSIEAVMPSNHLILCRSLLLLPSIFPSIRVFSNDSALRIRWPKYWSFSFSISPSNEHPGLISFRMDWLDLLAVQETLKRLLQHHSSKASILQHSAFFIVQLSHPYMTTGKTTILKGHRMVPA